MSRTNRIYSILIALGVVFVFSVKVASAVTITTVTYDNFSDLTGFTLNNSTAAIHGSLTSGTSPANPGDNTVSNGSENVLRLTNAGAQSGSAFLTDAISLAADASFSSAFKFQITDHGGGFDLDGGDGVQGADGLAFLIQTVSNTAGAPGGGIGYGSAPTGGIPDSLAIEFDTWKNIQSFSDDIDGNHIGITQNGDMMNSLAQVSVSTTMNNSADWFSWIDYDGANDILEVRLSMTDIRPTIADISLSNIDLPSILQGAEVNPAENAFIGFTSGTGGAFGTHDIKAWEFTNTFEPIGIVEVVPEPTTVALLGIGLAGLGVGYLRRSRKQKRNKSQ